jgi:hypothetical protein
MLGTGAPRACSPLEIRRDSHLGPALMELAPALTTAPQAETNLFEILAVVLPRSLPSSMNQSASRATRHGAQLQAAVRMRVDAVCEPSRIVWGERSRSRARRVCGLTEGESVVQ